MSHTIRTFAARPVHHLASLAARTRPARSAGSALVVRGAARDRYQMRDLFSEAAYGVGSRPGRLVLTIIGTVLGVGSLVVTVGLAQTAAGQIGRQFDAIAATQVVVEPTTTQTGGTQQGTGHLPWDVADRLARIAGVRAVGAVATVDIADAKITALPVIDPSAPTLAAPVVLATTSGLLEAVHGSVVTGRYFDSGHDARADRVVVLGVRAAARLGVNHIDRQPSIFIGQRPYAVIGIIDQVERRTDLLDAVILPVGTARKDFAFTGLDQAQVRIAVAAGPVLSAQAPIAVDPNHPESITVQAPPATVAVRASVQADINAIFLALGAVALLVGGLGIANVTLLSVRERTGEIGLRRALGASKTDIGRQFLVESLVIGLLGGLVGAALGVLTVLLVCLAQGWIPILDTLVTFSAVLLGGLIGLAAGTYPALKAAQIEPITALRAGT